MLSWLPPHAFLPFRIPGCHTCPLVKIRALDSTSPHFALFKSWVFGIDAVISRRPLQVSSTVLSVLYFCSCWPFFSLLPSLRPLCFIIISILSIRKQIRNRLQVVKPLRKTIVSEAVNRGPEAHVPLNPGSGLSTCLWTQPTVVRSPPLPFFFLCKDFFVHFWLCWIFIGVCGPSSVVASGGLLSSFRVQASHCRGFSCR